MESQYATPRNKEQRQQRPAPGGVEFEDTRTERQWRPTAETPPPNTHVIAGQLGAQAQARFHASSARGGSPRISRKHTSQDVPGPWVPESGGKTKRGPLLVLGTLRCACVGSGESHAIGSSGERRHALRFRNPTIESGLDHDTGVCAWWSPGRRLVIQIRTLAPRNSALLLEFY